MKELFAVAVGGALGSVIRYGANVVAATLLGRETVTGTLAVNGVGSLLIGVCAASCVSRDPFWSAALATGFLGGLTTFSTFSLETLRLAQQGRTGWAAFNVLSNIALGVTAAYVGLRIGRPWR